MTETRSPETYIGYSRAKNFVSPGGAVKDVSHLYSTEAPRVDQWSLGGDWTVGEQKATLNKEGRSTAFACDLHLVLGSADEGKQIRFRATIDGAAPGADHGADTDADRRGVSTSIGFISSLARAAASRITPSISSFLIRVYRPTRLPLGERTDARQVLDG